MNDFLFYGQPENDDERYFPGDFDPPLDPQPTDEEIDAMADAIYEREELEHAAHFDADVAGWHEE